jgi:hypothetical protein
MSDQELELPQAPIEEPASEAPEHQTDDEVRAIKEEAADPGTPSELTEEVN